MSEPTRIEWHFHWKFWAPNRDVVGGPIYFGWWGVVHAHGNVVAMTAEQIFTKQDMDLI